jgi:serine/threonine-protein kinase
MSNENQTLDSIDPALLAELTRALLPYLGPYSITTVKRASRASADPQEIMRMVSGHIDDLSKRELFLQQAKRILADFRAKAPTNGAAATTPATGGRPATPVTPELMKRGEVALAPIIGPLASVLVSRYANAAANSREFFERLAGHLRSAEERDSFFTSVRNQESLAGAAR